MRVWRHRQPSAELDSVWSKLKATPPHLWCGVYVPPTSLNCQVQQLLLLLAGPQFKHTVYRETLCNHVIKFVLPRIQALKCQRPSRWLQAHHMTPQGWGHFSQALPGTF